MEGLRADVSPIGARLIALPRMGRSNGSLCVPYDTRSFRNVTGHDLSRFLTGPVMAGHDRFGHDRSRHIDITSCLGQDVYCNQWKYLSDR